MKRQRVNKWYTEWQPTLWQSLPPEIEAVVLVHACCQLENCCRYVLCEKGTVTLVLKEKKSRGGILLTSSSVAWCVIDGGTAFPLQHPLLHIFTMIFSLNVLLKASTLC